MQHYNYSLTDLQMMMPWEREVYLTLLQQHLEEEKERYEEEKRRMRM